MTVESPEIHERTFLNLDAALDYCKFAQPKSIYITMIERFDGKFCWLLQYKGSDGNE